MKNSSFNPTIAGITLLNRNIHALQKNNLPINKNHLYRSLPIDNHYLYSKEVIQRWNETKLNPKEYPKIYSDLVFIKVFGKNIQEVENELINASGNSKKIMPLTEYLTRNISIFFTKHLWIKLPITANQISLISLIFIIAGSTLFLNIENIPSRIISFILIFLGFVFDCCDGEIARIKLQQTNYGAWLDSTFDRISEATIIFFMTLLTNTWILSFILLFGVFMVNLTGAYVPQHLKTNKHPTGGIRQGNVKIDWYDFGRSTQIFLYPTFILLGTPLLGLLFMCAANNAYWIQRIQRYKKWT